MAAADVDTAVDAGEDGTEVGVVEAALGLADSGELVPDSWADAELGALVGGTVAGTSSVADGGTV